MTDWERVRRYRIGALGAPAPRRAPGRCGCRPPIRGATAAASAAAPEPRARRLAPGGSRPAERRGHRDDRVQGSGLLGLAIRRSGLRQSTDIDLLVRRREALAARRCCRQPVTGSGSASPIARRSGSSATRTSTGCGTRTGTSWNCRGRSRPAIWLLDLDADRFFADARSIEGGGRPRRRARTPRSAPGPRRARREAPMGATRLDHRHRATPRDESRPRRGPCDRSGPVGRVQNACCSSRPRSRDCSWVPNSPGLSRRDRPGPGGR